MFELPENLGELSAEALNDLLAAAREEAKGLTTALSAGEDIDLDRLEVLADAIDSLLAAAAELSVEDEVEAEDDEDRDARAAALAARFATNDAIEDVEEEVEEVVTEPIVASAKAPAKKPAAKLVLPQAKTMNSALVAAANLSGTAPGANFENLGAVVPHLMQAFTGLQGASNGARRELFSIQETNIDPKLVADRSNGNEVIKYAIDQNRLGAGTGAARLAAGGWCAPAEQRYDICQLAGLDGLVDLPHISVPRGSISYFRALDYNSTCAAAQAGIGDFTNAELEALPPVVKPCVEVPCATPVTFTLDAVSFCVRAGVLQHRAFPELVEAWLQQALICYHRYLNARKLAAIRALAAVNTVNFPATFGAWAQLLEALDLQATDIRFDNGMTENEVIEGIAPWWLPLVLRADASRRQFNADWTASLATFNAALAARNIRLQYVKDFQDAPFVGAAPVTALPTEVDIILYPAGAYVDASDPIIRVGALQDSTLLTTNREQLLFVETAEGILPACGDGRLLTINFCASGETAGPVAPIGTATCG